jgi:hypothetical protein
MTKKDTKTTSLNPTYNISDITYNSIFEFAKAQHEYYSKAASTHNEDDNLKHDAVSAIIHNEGNLNISKDDMLTINSHIIKLLDETFKKEVNKNILLQQEAKRYKERISTLERNIQDKTLENVMLDKRLKELDRAEKNRKDPKHREQLVKISLLIGFGIMLWAGSYYL